MRVHIISNSLRLNSGFGVVARYIGKGLIKLGHHVNMTGMQTLYIPDYTFGIEQLPLLWTPLNEEMQLGQNMVVSNPDVVLCIFQGDMNFNYMTRTFSRTVFYPPVEGKNIPRGMANDLTWLMNNGGMVVGQCKYGLEEIKKVGIVGAKYIYHGYNDKIFKPIDLSGKGHEVNKYCYLQTEVGKANTDPVLLHKLGCYDCNDSRCNDSRCNDSRCNDSRCNDSRCNDSRCNDSRCNDKCKCDDKCRWWREEVVRVEKWIDFGEDKGSGWAYRDILISDLIKESQGRFVYLFVGQNNGVRKRIERLLRAYAILISNSKQMVDRTILHLHTNAIVTSENSPGIDLHMVTQELGLQNNVIFSYGNYISSGWSEEAMEILYNTADCFVTASSSEGYGLPVLESMACGLPVIAPACSSFVELVGDDRGLLVPIGEWQMIENHSFRALVDECKLATAMEKLYKDNELREKYGRNASEWAKLYSWDKVLVEWNKLLTEMVGKK